MRNISTLSIYIDLTSLFVINEFVLVFPTIKQGNV